jgi:hypothetical protein
MGGEGGRRQGRCEWKMRRGERFRRRDCEKDKKGVEKNGRDRKSYRDET